MSLHYLLDGYNIIHQIPKLLEYKLESQREKFIYLIQTQNFVGSARNKVTIVFDGQPEIYGQNQYEDVAVVFSQNETADDKIKRLVNSASNRKNIRVVTDDRALQYSVKASGARVISVDTFLSSQKGSNKQSKTTNSQINLESKLQITSEFKDIWLKGKD